MPHHCDCNFTPTGTFQRAGITYVRGKNADGTRVEVPMVEMCTHMQVHIRDLLDREAGMQQLLQSLVQNIHKLQYRLGQLEGRRR